MSLPLFFLLSALALSPLPSLASGRITLTLPSACVIIAQIDPGTSTITASHPICAGGSTIFDWPLSGAGAGQASSMAIYAKFAGDVPGCVMGMSPAQAGYLEGRTLEWRDGLGQIWDTNSGGLLLDTNSWSPLTCGQSSFLPLGLKLPPTTLAPGDALWSKSFPIEENSGPEVASEPKPKPEVKPNPPRPIVEVETKLPAIITVVRTLAPAHTPSSSSVTPTTIKPIVGVEEPTIAPSPNAQPVTSVTTSTSAIYPPDVDVKEPIIDVKPSVTVIEVSPTTKFIPSPSPSVIQTVIPAVVPTVKPIVGIESPIEVEPTPETSTWTTSILTLDVEPTFKPIVRPVEPTSRARFRSSTSTSATETSTTATFIALPVEASSTNSTLRRPDPVPTSITTTTRDIPVPPIATPTSTQRLVPSPIILVPEPDPSTETVTFQPPLQSPSPPPPPPIFSAPSPSPPSPAPVNTFPVFSANFPIFQPTSTIHNGGDIALPTPVPFSMADSLALPFRPNTRTRKSASASSALPTGQLLAAIPSALPGAVVEPQTLEDVVAESEPEGEIQEGEWDGIPETEGAPMVDEPGAGDDVVLGSQLNTAIPPQGDDDCGAEGEEDNEGEEECDGEGDGNDEEECDGALIAGGATDDGGDDRPLAVPCDDDEADDEPPAGNGDCEDEEGDNGDDSDPAAPCSDDDDDEPPADSEDCEEEGNHEPAAGGEECDDEGAPQSGGGDPGEVEEGSTPDGAAPTEGDTLPPSPTPASNPAIVAPAVDDNAPIGVVYKAEPIIPQSESEAEPGVGYEAAITIEQDQDSTSGSGLFDKIKIFVDKCREYVNAKSGSGSAAMEKREKGAIPGRIGMIRREGVLVSRF